MQTASDIIDALGGTNALARALDLTPSTVSSWKGSGTIPRWWHPALIQHAASIGIAMSVGDIPDRRQPAGADS